METKTCKSCDSRFEITDTDLEFYRKISPVFDGKKYLITSPTLCPDCRNIRRLSFRNEGKLYKRKCDYSGKEIISMYGAHHDLIVYDKEIWWSDKIDVEKYGKEIDFKKSFFKQFQDLLKNTPIPSLTVSFESENSKYAIYSGKMKNCYMLFAAWDCQYTMYSSKLLSTNYVVDSTDGTSLEKCYQIVSSENCFGCFYLLNSNNCQNCYFSYDLENCSDCFLCYNLVGKKYHIKNIEYQKDDYIKELKKIKNKYFNIGWDFLDEIIPKTINKNLMMINCEKSIGDNLKNCKNCLECFHLKDAENCKFTENGGMGCYNTYDARGVGENLQFGYEILDTGINAMNNYFLISSYTCNNAFYSINCHNSNNIFGCLGIRNKSYCILNKQYTKEEYNKLVPKIIEHMQKTGEWGEFFPSSLSPFGYNETVVQEYFPIIPPARSSLNPHLRETEVDSHQSNQIKEDDNKLTGKENESKMYQFHYNPSNKEGKGTVFNWSTYEPPLPKVDKIIPANKLPDNIKDIPDDILNWAIECEVTKKPFRIIKEELEFYRKHNLPIPRRHPDQRHLDRLKINNPKKIVNSNCSKCEKDIKTIFTKESGKIVYCQNCYDKEIY